MRSCSSAVFFDYMEGKNMMKEEFERLVGKEISERDYSCIEQLYYAMQGDKQAFGRWCLKNWAAVEHLVKLDAEAAEKIQTLEKHMCSLKEQLAAREDELSKVKARLEKEEEWKPYELEENVPREKYESLLDACKRVPSEDSNNFMSDREAADLMADLYGFEKDKIKILREVPVYEINRHRQLRQVGIEKRDPLYFASDWNYIRFDCERMTWEYFNDDLRPFYH